MATYTGSTQATPRVGKIWLAVVAFAIAAVLVIALVAMQGGSKAPSRPSAGPTQSHLIRDATNGESRIAGTTQVRF
jgi:hypothetical protein